jgi:hypothetical protein
VPRTVREHRAALAVLALVIAVAAGIVAAVGSSASSSDTVAAGAGDRPGASGAMTSSSEPPDAGAAATTVPQRAKVAGLGPERTIPAPDTTAPAGQNATRNGGTRSATTVADGGDRDGDSDDAAASTVPPADTAPQRPSEVEPAPTTAPADVRCVVRLHGKGGNGAATTTDGAGRVVLRPAGNSAAWGGRQWMYFPDGSYASARASVEDATIAAGCTKIVIVGFSNGAAFAAKLYCHGERFGGRLVGVIVDDPVPDQGVQGCAPARGVRAAVYWTGALAQAAPGWSCAQADWTCEGGSTIGIDAYAAALGVSVKQSPMGGHQEYANPPELSAWL